MLANHEAALRLAVQAGLDLPTVLAAAERAIEDGEEHGRFREFDDGCWSCHALRSQYAYLCACSWGDTSSVEGVWRVFNSASTVDEPAWWETSEGKYFPEKLDALRAFVEFLKEEVGNAA